MHACVSIISRHDAFTKIYYMALQKSKRHCRLNIYLCQWWMHYVLFNKRAGVFYTASNTTTNSIDILPYLIVFFI
jgi:hypothetical protein